MGVAGRVAADDERSTCFYNKLFTGLLNFARYENGEKNNVPSPQTLYRCAMSSIIPNYSWPDFIMATGLKVGTTKFTILLSTRGHFFLVAFFLLRLLLLLMLLLLPSPLLVRIHARTRP